MQRIIVLTVSAALVLVASDVAAQQRAGDPRAQSGVNSSRDGNRGGGVVSSRDQDVSSSRDGGGVVSSRDGGGAVSSRGDDRYGSAGGYHAERYRVPRGFMPPRGMCRIWLEGVPAGRQPRVTDCETALRHRPVNGRVLFGSEGITRSGHDRLGRTQYTVYRVYLNNRRCEVREQFDRYGRAHYERRCEQTRRSSRDDWWGHDPYRHDGRIRFGEWVRI